MRRRRIRGTAETKVSEEGNDEEEDEEELERLFLFFLYCLHTCLFVSISSFVATKEMVQLSSMIGMRKRGIRKRRKMRKRRGMREVIPLLFLLFGYPSSLSNCLCSFVFLCWKSRMDDGWMKLVGIDGMDHSRFLFIMIILKL